ncbi:MAG: hypothetical protein GX495_12225 [Chloroflexi bacterium]|jgi:hypothetical protein|nr:hypothetical protein [Chloroflexota bacterium]
MDIGQYRRFVREYVKQALDNSDGSHQQIVEYLRSQVVKGLFVRHKEERKKALEDVQRAFEEHRHWPVDIVVSSYLGVDLKEDEISS